MGCVFIWKFALYWLPITCFLYSCIYLRFKNIVDVKRISNLSTQYCITNAFDKLYIAILSMNKTSSVYVWLL